MKYYVTIGGREYEVAVGNADKAVAAVVVDGEEFVVDFWRAPGSPFVASS